MALPLPEDQKKQLSRWIGGQRAFQLLYSASTDGCSAAAFHSKCDNKGPTIVLVRNGAEYVFGGYTQSNWNSSTGQTYDDKAFLFRLIKNGNFDPKRYLVKDAAYAIVNDAKHGPSFGKSEFLVCGAGPFEKKDGYFPCEAKVTDGGTYDLKSDTVTEINGGNTDIADIQVFKVIENELKEPWRKLGDTDFEPLVSWIEDYVPIQETKLNSVNIMMVGAVGAGKSSYFNTINSIFRGHVTGQARSGSASTSLTSSLMSHKIRTRKGSPMKFRMLDTRGLEEDKGIRAEDLVAVLDGHLENGFRFNPFGKLDQSVPGYRRNPTFGDTVHCVAFVVDASTVDVYSDKILKIIKEFQETVNFRGVPQVILLTKIDKVCPSLDADLSTLYHNSTVADLVDTVAQMFGLPRLYVLPMKNYEGETELDQAIDIPVLISLRQLLRSVDDYLYFHLDKQVERQTD